MLQKIEDDICYDYLISVFITNIRYVGVIVDTIIISYLRGLR